MYISKYFVEATYREEDCDKYSPIVKLHLNEKYNGFYGHPVKELKNLADSGKLFVKTGPHCNGVKVKIYYSYAYSRWIASTVADSRECNNLLTLPIYSSSYTGSNITYSVCRI
tara:strand:+ start:250 stop:588 length:339 start_codon:yes stop_codon:yes gene_type:complete